MTAFQYFLIFVSFVFLLFIFDAYKRKGMNFVHFLVFFVGLISILLFSIEWNLLDNFWAYFGLNRWADLLVYMSIVFILYLYFEILHKLIKQQKTTTDIISFQAIDNFFEHNDKQKLFEKSFSMLWENSNFIFLVRCFNEWQVLWDQIDKIIQSWYNKILLVNDGSVDNTFDIINQKKLDYPNSLIIDLHHIVNRWGGAANKTWFNFLNKYLTCLWVTWLITFDSDWQMDINDMEIFKKYISENSNYDLFLWSRFVQWANVDNIPISRRIILFWAKFVTYIFNWVWVDDPHNWYRAINLKSLNNINIYSDGMTYASEILDSIKINNLKYKEVPVNIKYTNYTIKKWQKNINAFKILLEIIYKKFFFR